MLADPLGPLACGLRGGGLHLCGACVNLVGVRAHGGYGIAAIELSEKALGVALVGHVDEGLLLDLFPAFLTDLRPAFFFLPGPGGLGLADLEHPDEGDYLAMFSCGRELLRGGEAHWELGYLPVRVQGGQPGLPGHGGLDYLGIDVCQGPGPYCKKASMASGWSRPAVSAMVFAGRTGPGRLSRR